MSTTARGATIATLPGIIITGAAVCAIILVVRGSQRGDESARDMLVDLLLFGTDHPINASAYPPGVRGELDRYLQRYKAYHSRRVRPVLPGLTRGEDGMVYAAWVRYERTLAAVSPEPTAPALARAYVDRLRPCYEWEGFHGCPEREAKFAVEYQTANPSGPFRDYLPFWRRIDGFAPWKPTNTRSNQKAPDVAGGSTRNSSQQRDVPEAR